MSKPLTHRVLETLHKNPGLSVKEISELLGISVERARNLLYKLKSSGFVERAGKGYMLTERGARFLEYLEKSRKSASPERVETSSGQPVESLGRPAQVTLVETPVVESASRRELVEPRYTHLDVVEELKRKVESLEKRVESLERAVRNLEQAMQTRQRRAESIVLEEPVMFYNDAVNKYGQVYVERLISEGRVKKIGALVVDSEFYGEFKAKFPIKIQEADKLSHHEKILLDEMRREAMVVLFAGKEYRLLET